MRELAERGYFALCLTLGRLLRAARYSTTRIVDEDGERRVRKRRAFHAPLLVWLGGPLAAILDTGVWVLARREWEERERALYRAVHGTSIRVEADGTLVLPCLAGETLATLLDDAGLAASARRRGIVAAVVALAALHARGLTHGDAMAENVLVDLTAGIARWFDFETVHDPRRPTVWRRADDVRALLTTCLVRTGAEQRAETVRLVLDVYADDRVTRVLATTFTSVFRRALALHLGQAGLSLESFRDIARLLWARVPGATRGSC